MIKDSVIKARCSNNEKQQIQEYIQAHDIKESAFLLSAVQTTLQCDIPENHDEEISFFYQYQCNLLLNRILNLISLDPTIPEKTKERIRKELDSHDYSQFIIR